MSEQRVWTGRPSHWLNFKIYFWCVLAGWLVLPLLLLVWKWIALKSTRYELTTERLKVHAGVFNRETNELELYRVKDYRLEQPFLLRMVGRSTLVLSTNDESSPVVRLAAIAKGQDLRETVRNLVETRRRNRQVRDVEVY